MINIWKLINFELSWIEESIKRFKESGGNSINANITIGEFISSNMKKELSEVVNMNLDTYSQLKGKLDEH